MDIDDQNPNEPTGNENDVTVERNPVNTAVNEERGHDLKEIPINQLISNLLVMAIKWRYNTTHTLAQEILKLVNISSKINNSKSSKYYWKIILDRYSQHISTHYICDNCGNYLGCEASRLDCCDSCHLEVDYESNKGSFLRIPLGDQLKDLFEKTDAHNLYSKNRKKINHYAIEHIYDGKMYKKQVLDDDMISIYFNLDGAPIFEGSNTSVYPVLCTINELNPYERRDNILLSSVWFGVSKPKKYEQLFKTFCHRSEDASRRWIYLFLQKPNL